MSQNKPEIETDDFDTLLEQAAQALHLMLTLGVPEDGPAPSIPAQLFLRCDCCDRPMRSETVFVCIQCRMQYRPNDPPMQAVLERGMEHIDAMRDAWSEAHCAGVWN